MGGNETVPKFFTARDIDEYLSQGQKKIILEEMPVFTDEAREKIARNQIEIVLKSKAEPAKTSPAPPIVEESLPPRVTFKQKLQMNTKLLGTFIATPHPVITEFVGKLGFDFGLIDAEHNAMSIETVQAMLQGIALTPSYGIVRVPTIRYEYIAGYLDAGADALLIPQVRTAEDVLAVRDAALYPPEGKRGIGPGRGSAYGQSLGEKRNQPNKDTCIIIQIETLDALDNLEAILAIDFFDSVFIGPGDLSMNLGVFGEFNNPILTNQVQRVIDEGKRFGKKVAMFCANVEMALNWFKNGVDMVVLDSELGLLAGNAKQAIARIKNQA
jgi:4-hydroxy-2-oxoheptanedioate aldolase